MEVYYNIAGDHTLTSLTAAKIDAQNLLRRRQYDDQLCRRNGGSKKPDELGRNCA